MDILEQIPINELNIDRFFADQQELLDKYSIPDEDVFEVGKTEIADFDAKCQQAGTGYEAPHFPYWSEKMEGLQNGFYIFAGVPNSGKTAYVTNLALDYALHEANKLFLIYYSLDDTKEDVLSRIVAMRQRIPISVVRKPQRFLQKIREGENGSSAYEEQLKKRAEGIEELKQLSNRFRIVDTDTIDCVEKLLNHAKMIKKYLQGIDPENNILVCIDSLMDINIDSEKFREERDRNTKISQLVKNYANVELQCPIFGTAHVRKNTARHIQISDLKESGRYEYDARAVFLVSNDVSRNGQSAEIFYTVQGSSYKEPVIEIQWAKNKASSFKERSYCYFVPNYSLTTECGTAQIANYNSIVYTT